MVRASQIVIFGFVLLQVLFTRAQEPLVIPDDRLLIEGIEIEGNRVTKEKIILRELTFQVGDTENRILAESVS